MASFSTSRVPIARGSVQLRKLCSAGMIRLSTMRYDVTLDDIEPVKQR